MRVPYSPPPALFSLSATCFFSPNILLHSTDDDNDAAITSADAQPSTRR